MTTEDSPVMVGITMASIITSIDNISLLLLLIELIIVSKCLKNYKKRNTNTSDLCTNTAYRDQSSSLTTILQVYDINHSDRNNENH